MITVVYGTRPEAIKLLSVVAALRARGAEVRVICTGQHRDLLDGTDLKPDVSLDLMKPGQELSSFVAEAMCGLSSWAYSATGVVVQGDTATAFAASMAAFHRQVPVVHVEAGLRTNRLDSPFPEEGYRQMIDRIASRLYAPTEMAAANILRERPDARVLVTGNTGIDAALGVPTRLSKHIGPYVLVTVHRREAFGEPLQSIVRAVRRISRHIPVVWPVHPNPHVQRVVRLLENEQNVRLVDPMNYPDLIATLRAARFVITDSGGIQEEAPTFGIPALVVREVTERQEAVVAGASICVGHDEETIVLNARRLLEPGPYEAMGVPRQLYGDGHAGERIAKDLVPTAGET